MNSGISLMCKGNPHQSVAGWGGKNHRILEDHRLPRAGKCPKIIYKLERICIDCLYISDNKYKEHCRCYFLHVILYNYRRINQYLNMPSLQALEEFKDSFNNLGGEPETLRVLDLPPDDLTLPANEPEAADLSGESEFPAFDDAGDELDLGNEIELDSGSGEETGEVSADDLDLSGMDDFFDNMENGFHTDEDDAGTDEERSDDAGVLDDTDEDAFSELDPGEDFFGEDDIEGFDLPEVTDDEPQATDEARSDEADTDEIEFPDLSEFGLDSEAASDDADTDDVDLSDIDFPDMDLPEVADDEPQATNEAGTDEAQSDEADTDEIEFPDLSEFGLDSEAASDDAGTDDVDLSDIDFPDMDLPEVTDEEPQATEPEATDDIDFPDIDLGDGDSGDLGDSFDTFEMDTGPGFSFAGDDDSDAEGDSADIDIPGLHSIFDNETDEFDDDGSYNIQLSEKDLEKFLKNLTDLPLNLRIACQEIISESSASAEQMARLIKIILNDSPIQDVATLAGRIQGRVINIPKGLDLKTGEELEIEQGSFAYIFFHSFLPMFRLFMGIAAVLFSIGYLYWHFIYTPMRAERIYQLGLERIEEGQYARANERFNEAYNIRPRASWFYAYARAFRDARQYNLADEKYRQLLHFTASRNNRGIPEKAAVLEYADLLTNYMGNYEAADRVIWRNILDYTPLDRDALLALGDNALAWGEFEPDRYEDARHSYALLIEHYGESDPLMERMLLYFIRTDNLEHVLGLHSYFMETPNTRISAAALAEMGGYLFDKMTETVRGVPNEFLGNITGGAIREPLLRALRQDALLPEAYYHLVRYYNYYSNYQDEVYTLELAVRVFDFVDEGNARRMRYHIDTLRRYADVLIQRREFFLAEDHLVKAVRIFENGLSRRLFTPSPEFGKIYADLGNLEFFVKQGDMQSALRYYREAELNGWAPPEILYRMGAAHYMLREWGPAQDYLFAASRDAEQNRRILYALGNISYMRGNYYSAEAYYSRVLDILEADRARLPAIRPTDNAVELDLAERLMVVQNNMGVTLEALTERTGNSQYRFQAHGLYADSQRAWDILTRDPVLMTRMRPSADTFLPGVNPPFLNIQNSLYPVPGFEHLFFMRIDMDMLEPSVWEEIATPGYSLSQGIHTGR